MGKIKTKVSAFLKKVWAAIGKAWDRLNDEVKVLVPVAINVTQVIKEIVKEGTFTGSILDMITLKIPGTIDDRVLELIRKWVPELLLRLVVVKNINDIDDPNEQLVAILEEIKLFNDDQKELFWDGFAKKFLEYAADGITKDEVGYLIKWYYDNKK